MTFDLKWARGKFPALKDTDEKLQAKRQQLAAIFNEAGPELDPSKVRSVQITDGTDLHEVIAAYNTELEDLKAELDKHMGSARAAYGVLHGASGGETGDGHDPDPDDEEELRPAKPFGRMFTDSQAYTGYRPGQGIGPVAHLDVHPLALLRPRATLFERTAGWDPEETRSGLVTLLPTRPAPHVVDFIPSGPITQAAFKYMEETTFTNNAAEVAEGGAYGEAALVLTERTQNVEKIGVWLPVTDEQLEDEPAARAYVETRLVFMARQRLDAQVLVGNGTAPNLKGTENVVGIQTQALGTDPIPDAILKLFTKIRDDGFAEPNVVFIRPSKWETVRLLRTADGVYIWGHPSTPGPETIWGVNVVQTTAPTATKAVAGDYATHSMFLLKRGVDVQVTNSHSTDFVNGKQAIRADLRGVMVHVRPKAFGTVTGL